MKDPALDALRIADLAPYFELGGDFDRQPSPLIDPFCRVVLRRAFPQVDAVGLQAGEARQGQLGDRSDWIGDRQAWSLEQDEQHRKDVAASGQQHKDRVPFSSHTDFLDDGSAILVFARSSAREATKPAARDPGAALWLYHLRRLSLTRRKLFEGANADG